MDIKLLKNCLLQNNIPNLMIFIATESFLCKQYIDAMSKSLNTVSKYYDTADQVLYDITTNLKEDYLYVIMNDFNILKNLSYVEELIKFKDRHIIIYFNELDVKGELYKNYKDLCVTFNKLDKYTMLAYLMKQLDKAKIEVSQEKIEKLIDYCSCNMGCCVNELDKIIALDQSNSNLLIDYMLNNGFSDYRNINIYNFIYKILNKDKSVFEDRLRVNESNINIISILYKQILSRLEKSTNNIVCANLLQLCSKLDYAIKNGTLNDKYILDYLILKVFDE